MQNHYSTTPKQHSSSEKKFAPFQCETILPTHIILRIFFSRGSQIILIDLAINLRMLKPLDSFSRATDILKNVAINRMVTYVRPPK